MALEQELERLCTPKTLQRARQIAASDENILTKKCRFDRTITRLSAFVASSRGWNDCYRTSASIDEEADRVVDYACTCPAALRYDGPCKHCAALVYAYRDRPSSFMGYREHRRTETTACLAELMRRNASLDASDETGKIDIVPVLTYAYRTWSARFKIVGTQGAYVMKDIAAFVDDMRDGAWRSYGKKLAFVHAPDSFCAHGKALASCIERMVSTRRGAGPRLSRERVLRAIDLEEFEVVDMLDIEGDATFQVEGGDRSVRARTLAHVEQADPELDIRLAREQDGGVSITAGRKAVPIAHGSRLYLWEDDVFYRCSCAYAAATGFLRMLCAGDDETLYIAEEDLPLFCSELLPRIEKTLRVEAPASLDAYRPVEGRLEFYFDRSATAITCEAHACYAASRRVLARGGSFWKDDGAARPLFDEKLERRALRLVGDYFPENAATGENGSPGEHALPLGDSERVGALLFGGLARFAEAGAVFTTAAFDRLISDGKPRVSFGVSLSGDLIRLDPRADDLDPDELSALLASYRARRRYHRLKTGAFLDIAQLDLAQLDRIASDLDLSSAELASGVIELPAWRAFYLDETLDSAERSPSFESYLERFRASLAKPRAVPSWFKTTLRPYQREGIDWMNALADRGLSGILADEMGLGKSVQLIAFLATRLASARATGPSLLVCPASLVYNWTAEFERFAAEISVCAVAGTKQERMRARAREDVDVFVTSYDLLRIDIDEYRPREFYCCVLDEAQYIKNHGTLTARAAKRIRARHRFALTGTPVENRLSEIWSIFDFLMPGLLGSAARFKERFELDIVGGNEQAAARLKALIGPFMLRRLKSDVLQDLPDKLESTVLVPMTRKQDKLYYAHEQRLRESLAQRRAKAPREDAQRKAGVEVLSELMRLRLICCDPRLVFENYEDASAKIEAIVDLVESARNDGQKCLVFSQFTSFLALIAERLAAAGMQFCMLTGSTPRKERIAMANAFNDDDTQAFLISLKAGGTGLNLTGASVVIHADPWWNAAAQNQATDRAHRIGQTRIVSVYRIIAKGTVEERIVELQRSKTELADKIMGIDADMPPRLTEEALIDLFQDRI